MDSQAAKQIELGFEIVFQHVIGPPHVDGVPSLQQRGEAWREPDQPTLSRSRIGQQIHYAARQSLGFHYRGRVDPGPATSLQPDLCPRVRIRLPHDEVVADRIPLAAQIAGDDARRDARAPHQCDERRSIVTAETAPGVEQKIVH